MCIRLTEGSHHRTVVGGVALDGTLSGLVDSCLSTKRHLRMIGLRLINTFVKCAGASAGIYYQRLVVYALAVKFQT